MSSKKPEPLFGNAENFDSGFVFQDVSAEQLSEKQLSEIVKLSEGCSGGRSPNKLHVRGRREVCTFRFLFSTLFTDVGFSLLQFFRFQAPSGVTSEKRFAPVTL